MSSTVAAISPPQNPSSVCCSLSQAFLPRKWFQSALKHPPCCYVFMAAKASPTQGHLSRGFWWALCGWAGGWPQGAVVTWLRSTSSPGPLLQHPGQSHDQADTGFCWLHDQVDMGLCWLCDQVDTGLCWLHGVQQSSTSPPYWGEEAARGSAGCSFAGWVLPEMQFQAAPSSPPSLTLWPGPCRDGGEHVATSGGSCLAKL